MDHGWLYARNNQDQLYLLIDLTADTVADPPKAKAPWGDYLSISVDVDLDGKITPNKDVAFALFPGSYRLGRQAYLGPGRWTGLQATRATLAAGFGKSPVSGRKHRIWELAIPLEEIGARPGGQIRLGLTVNSTRPRFSEAYPASQTHDFRELVTLHLASTRTPAGTPVISPSVVREPGTHQPSNTEGSREEEPHRCSPAGGVVKRELLPDGTVEVQYANGVRVQRGGGGIKTFCQDGTMRVAMFMNVLPTLPPTLPDSEEAKWLAGHSDSLLTIIRYLVDDPDMVSKYQATEPADMNIYRKIDARSQTINRLLSP